MSTPPVLGRYRLDQEVGQGGMAVVWRAYDTQLRRTVAVKVLHAHLNQRAEVRRRFDREAHAVARLHHPHILDVYDFSGPEADPSYLVTEFIPGHSLRAFADAHPFDPPELALLALLPIAEALEHAHAAGVVHRDVKPENVMVREDGLVKLTDFGIAALLDPEEKMTATGSILGSPGHLAPETIEGKPTDPRSDLFSFGTILYWLACGELPFRAQSPAALLQKILECKPTDPRLLRRSVSDGLARLIARCLERDPAQRLQSAGELKREILALLSDAGLDDPAAELRAFVAAPEPAQVAAGLRARLVERALGRGEQALKEHRTSLALSEFGRVLSLLPTHALARERVERIRRRAKLVKRLKRLGAALGALALALAIGVPVVRAVRAARAERAQQLQLAEQRAAEETVRRANQAHKDDEARIAALVQQVQQSRALEEQKAADAKRAEDERKAQLAGTDAPTRRRGPGKPPRVRLAANEPTTHARLTSDGKVKVTLKPPLTWAALTLDGEDLGSNAQFTRELTVGPHELTVRHTCCADHTYIVDVRPEVERIALQFGTPKPARIEVRGAPADARVFVDESFVSSVAELPSRLIATDGKQMREVMLAVGERSKRVTLKAGFLNPIDYMRDLDGP